jgi:hypothetical protein
MFLSMAVTDISGQPIGLIVKGASLQMGPIGCPERSVTNYQSTLCNVPKEPVS